MLLKTLFPLPDAKEMKSLFYRLIIGAHCKQTATWILF